MRPTTADEQRICSLYSGGSRLSDAARESGFCITTVQRVLRRNGVTIRRHGNGRLRPKDFIDDSALLDFKKQWDCLDSTVKGTVSENYVKTRLAELGFDVWEPCCQNHRTDLIVIAGNTVRRIQVKSATYDPDTKCFRVNFSRRRRMGKRSDYNPADVDYFMVYCPGLPNVEIYVIPADQINQRNRCPRLFPHRKRLLICNEFSLEPYRNMFEALR